MLIWVTGLSGSGKSTLCNALYRKLKKDMPELVLLDGDVVRTAFGDDLGYEEADRVIQIKRIQNIGKVLIEQGLVVIVAALYSHPDLLAWNRAYLGRYFEVYMKASIKTVSERDPKGLYAGAASGRTPHVVGVDIPWRSPESPDLVIDADVFEDPDALASRVIAAAPWLEERPLE